MTDQMPPFRVHGGYVYTTVEIPPKCYRPKEHQGDCGEPVDQAEDEQRILYGRCGATPAPTGIIHAKDGKPWI